MGQVPGGLGSAWPGSRSRSELRRRPGGLGGDHERAQGPGRWFQSGDDRAERLEGDRGDRRATAAAAPADPAEGSFSPPSGPGGLSAASTWPGRTGRAGCWSGVARAWAGGRPKSLSRLR